MRAWEQATWDTGVREETVIDRVGQAIADWIRHHYPHAKRLLILAGKGHNGDDGRAAQAYLTDQTVDLVSVPEPETALPSLETALENKPDLILDCLFGIGLNRDLNADWQNLVARVNDCSRPIIAIDVPSGLCAQTGKVFGAAIEADVTLTVGAPKTGLLTPAALRHTGYVRVLTDVGLAPLSQSDPNAERLWTEPSDLEGWPTRKKAHDHKGTLGHVTLIAGSLGYHGAAVLAARAAMGSQAGLVTIVTQPECYAPVANQLHQAMVRTWSAPFIPPPRTSSLLVGPGLAHETLPAAVATTCQEAWRTAPFPVIADASALAWLLPAPDPPSERGLRVITPHVGEAARLLQWENRRVVQNPIDALRQLARTYGNAWVILKGAHTLIGKATGPIYVNPTGNPGLARGGSGDVLAGFLAGCLAQPRCVADPDKALRLAVWAHGATAEHLALLGEDWNIETLAQAIHPNRR